MRSTCALRPLAALAALVLLAGPGRAITLDFETEDDFATPLVNGQIVDPAADGADLEFGNLVDVSSTQTAGGNDHGGVTVFDTDPAGPNSGGGDPDLLVDTGNILILQNSALLGTSVGANGLEYDTPDDEADGLDAGSIVFDFLLPVELLSIDLVDINGGNLLTLTLTDVSALTRTYSVPMQWTNDVTVSPDGWDTLQLDTLAAQDGEGPGGSATAVEDAGFDPTQVLQLDVFFHGNPTSGGVDNLVFVPEPATALLALLGLASLARRRQP